MGFGSWSFAGGPAVGKEFVEVFGGVDADGGQAYLAKPLPVFPDFDGE
jgi:hypothetical protein